MSEDYSISIFSKGNCDMIGPWVTVRSTATHRLCLEVGQSSKAVDGSKEQTI